MKDHDSSGKSPESKEDNKMSERENDEQLIDPPENQGGGKAEMDSQAEEAAAAIDPPSTDGGHKIS